MMGGGIIGACPECVPSFLCVYIGCVYIGVCVCMCRHMNVKDFICLGAYGDMCCAHVLQTNITSTEIK